jgi:hypothetical protein
MEKEVSNQLQAPVALTPRKDAMVQMGRKLDGSVHSDEEGNNASPEYRTPAGSES